jgi:hypothetical protein
MINKKIIIAATSIILLLANLVFMLYKKHELELRLTNKKEMCVSRLQDLVERYESELDAIQQEIDNRVMMQANRMSNHDYIDSEEKYLDTSNISRETLGEFNESIKEIVTKKYHFLLKYLNIDSEILKQLRALLEKREEIALKIKDGKAFYPESGVTQEAIWVMEKQLADIDIQIEVLLDTDNQGRYALLKDSDIEQKQLNQYSLGVNGLFPLDDEQQESVLFVRLRHKAIFDKTIKTLDIETDYPLTRYQRHSLIKEVEMAAMRYKHGFLMEVHSVLDHNTFPMDQYTLLENHTNTEFNEMINNIHAKINARGVIN